jgi:hypothetical protein
MTVHFAKDISFFTGVPDSLLKDFCGYVADNTSKENHIIAANEGLFKKFFTIFENAINRLLYFSCTFMQIS